MLFVHDVVLVPARAVNLRTRYVYEPLDPILVLDRGTAEVRGAQDISLKERRRVVDRPRNMRLSSKMHDKVDATHDVLHLRGVAYVSVNELEALGLSHILGEILYAPGVR